MIGKKILIGILVLIMCICVVADDFPPGPPEDIIINYPPVDGSPPPAFVDPVPYDVYNLTLEVVEVRVKVDGKKDTLSSNGEKISREAESKSEVEFEIVLKNTHDKKLRNIDVDVLIYDVDGSDNLDDDEKIDELDSGETGTVELDFRLPLMVEHGDHKVSISLQGLDEDNNLHIFDWVLWLEIKQDKHNMVIEKASFLDSVSCSETAVLEVEILNLGREDEELKIIVENSDLDVFLEEEVALDSLESYETSFSFTLSDVDAGSYPFDVKVSYGREKEVEEVFLNVRGCGSARVEEEIDKYIVPELVRNEVAKVSAGKKPEVKVGGAEIALMLTLVFVILIGFGIFLLEVILLNSKKRKKK